MSYNDREITFSRLVAYLGPSFAGGVAVLVLAIITVVVPAIISSYNGSEIQRQSEQLRYSEIADDPLIGIFQITSDKIEQVGVLPALSSFVFFAVVGALLYLVVSKLIAIIADVNEFRRDLDYENLDRRQFINGQLLQLAEQITLLLIWLGLVKLFYMFLLPVLRLAIAITGNAQTVTDTLSYGAVSIIIVVICLHISVVFFRFINLRARLFS